MPTYARAGLITFDRSPLRARQLFEPAVSLCIYPERLVIVAEEHVVCTHERIIEPPHRQPRRVIYDWRHCLTVD